MAAFRKALELGAPTIEADVGFSRDCQLLLFRDDTLERTTNGGGSPSDFTLSELKELNAGPWWTPEVEPSFAWGRNYAGEKLITLDELFQ